ncbi:hypothetical protein Tco_1449690 [Tanacetum coccineum]
MSLTDKEKLLIIRRLYQASSKKDEEQYWADRNIPYRYIPVSEFSQRYKSFHVGEKLRSELSVPYDKKQYHKAALVTNKFSVPKGKLFKAAWDKEWLLMSNLSSIY